MGILNSTKLKSHDIKEIHIWSYRVLLDDIPSKPWLIKHYSKELEKSLIHQIFWQAFKLAKLVSREKCDILYTTDASTFCRFKPMVVMSQDLSCYENEIIKSYGYFNYALFRLYSILILQNIAFRSSAGVIFLTKYASKLVQSSCGHLKNFSIIPHGISKEFKLAQNNKEWPINNDEPIRCIYVSPLLLYKHQWIVVRAIYELRKKGYNIILTLIGGGSGKAKKILNNQINKLDPNKLFVFQMDFVSQKEIINQLKSSHIFLFASSCENMPITLLEAMAVGIPIACSSKGPMSEILENGGIYFDPKKHYSISEAVEKIIINILLRDKNKLNAKQISNKYSWERCAHETWNFISGTYWRINK